ncbi:MAG: DMT family transporter, partial [Pyramidobacter sp.]|nr:DMT family transporter [Pyramidobacter sp.]
PLYIFVLNTWLAHRPPTKIEWMTCFCLFIGIVLAFMGNLRGGGTLGNCFALISAFFYAGVYYLSKEEGAEPIESLFFGNAFYLLFLPVLVMNEAVWNTLPTDWGLLILFATLNGIGAWLCFAIGIRHTSALQANFITMTEPVMAPLWTFLFLHERITVLSVVGCAVVVVTLLAYHIAESRSG